MILPALALAGLTLLLTVPEARAGEVRPGVEVLVDDYAKNLRGKRVGILTNATGVDRDLNATIDLVRGLKEVEVVRLFSPEHGIRGVAAAGEAVEDGVDPISGLPVVSLYGATRKPRQDMLKDLDIVLYDIQDIGSRSYTYISTLTYMMEACQAAGVEVWVLDRPEPMGGHKVSGPMIDHDLMSFIGVHYVPQVYGMTPGEWARMIQGERTPSVSLTVIPLDNWRRGTTYGELGWFWVPPSPHIPRWETCYYYAMTGILGELGKVSEGVGTPIPFEQVGAPWLDGNALADDMNSRRLKGVKFRPTSFTPRYGSFADKECHGVQIYITDYDRVVPAAVSRELMTAMNRVAGDQAIFANIDLTGEPSLFLKALGDRGMAKALKKGDAVEPMLDRIQTERDGFLKRRQQYLIYK
jgi:uncharacterized protein YbbC (DUF1343 family)